MPAVKLRQRARPAKTPANGHDDAEMFPQYARLSGRKTGAAEKP
jgi:hypothetical protein